MRRSVGHWFIPSTIYQTVSLGNRVNKGKRRARVVTARAPSSARTATLPFDIAVRQLMPGLLSWGLPCVA